nr:reverse transcriptase domain-containing protein [Tanacetum cinerariifolium]
MEAFEVYDANRNHEPIMESGDENDYGNGNGGGNDNRTFNEMKAVTIMGIAMEMKAVTIMVMGTIVLEKKDQVEKFIGGLPDNIKGKMIAVGPTRLQDAVQIANQLMDQKLKGYDDRSVENKRRFYNNKGTTMCKNLLVKGKTWQELTRMGVMKERNMLGLCPTAIRGGEANPDSNVVTSTFLLNNPYASMLFDSGADRSYVSTTFSALLNVTASTLDFWRHNRYGLVEEIPCDDRCDEKVVRIPYGNEDLIIEDKSIYFKANNLPPICGYTELLTMFLSSTITTQIKSSKALPKRKMSSEFS